MAANHSPWDYITGNNGRTIDHKAAFDEFQVCQDWEGLGNCYLNGMGCIRNYNKAIKLFKKANSPTLVSTVYAFIGDFEKEIECLRTVNTKYAYARIGDIYYHEYDDYEKAINEYRKVKDAHVSRYDHPETDDWNVYNMGHCYYKVGNYILAYNCLNTCNWTNPLNQIKKYSDLCIEKYKSEQIELWTFRLSKNFCLFLINGIDVNVCNIISEYLVNLLFV